MSNYKWKLSIGTLILGIFANECTFFLFDPSDSSYDFSSTRDFKPENQKTIKISSGGELESDELILLNEKSFHHADKPTKETMEAIGNLPLDKVLSILEIANIVTDTLLNGGDVHLSLLTK